MEKNNFFPVSNKIDPKIYAYEDSHIDFQGMLKIGFTTKSVEKRVLQQYPIKRPKKTWTIKLIENAVKNDGSIISDHQVRNFLYKKGFKKISGEWVKCKVSDVQSAILSIKNNKEYDLDRDKSFELRPEQKQAIDLTIKYFKNFQKDNKKKMPHFLWNAKMRFGKTFATYHLMKKLEWKKILILTFKPAVQNSWKEDLMTHVDFENYQFVSKDSLEINKIKKNMPLVCFGSFQDFLGKNKSGGIKIKNEWVHSTNWDCIVLDEYHYGAWRESAQDLFDSEDEDEKLFLLGKGTELFDEKIIPITTNHFLYLSGTPFRAILSGEFIEEQIFNWTYTDEQKAKNEWKEPNNPYLSLPKMILMTYQLPENLREIAIGGEFNEFDLNTFFSATGSDSVAKFKYEEQVQKWLDIIRGNSKDLIYDNLKLNTQKPPLPFDDYNLKEILLHTLWFLPSVAACYAMKNLLEKKQNLFFHDYKIIVAAGKKAGLGAEALIPVLNAMSNPLESKTITLTCGKLTTGISIKPWTGILMLRSTSSPETYFQSAFRVQTPWTFFDSETQEEKIIKNNCYVFDFAPNRALRLIADYSCRLNLEESNAEKKVAEFIKFLPVLCFDGSSMKQVDATGILDIATSGTTATLLARRWESPLLVHVDDATLTNLINNPEAMKALMNIEGFRSLNKDIEAIINKTKEINDMKTKANEKDLSKKQKIILSENEKEQKNLRKQVQEKLIKFATRIPVFMYLSEYREKALKDVINELEPGLFNKVTGIRKSDFQLLVSLGVFNSSRMNDAIYKFKRYEDSSLSYLGYSTHFSEDIGLFDTVIKNTDLNPSLTSI